MTAASVQTRAAGGYNNYGVDYLSPKTAAQTIQITASADGSDPYIGFDGANEKLLIDVVGEFTAAAGVTIDSVLLKDGGARLLNNVNLSARNNANSADLNLLKLSTSDKLLFNVSVVDAATRTSLGAAASGANTDITSIISAGAVTLGSSNSYLQFESDGAVSWVVGDGNATIRPTVNNTCYIGAAGYRVNTVFTNAVNSHDGVLTVGPSGNALLELRSGSSTIYLDQSGYLRPGVNNTDSLGAAGDRWGAIHGKDMYADTFNLASKPNYTVSGTPTGYDCLRSVTVDPVALDLTAIRNAVNYMLSLHKYVIEDLIAAGFFQ